MLKDMGAISYPELLIRKRQRVAFDVELNEVRQAIRLNVYVNYHLGVPGHLLGAECSVWTGADIDDSLPITEPLCLLKSYLLGGYNMEDIPRSTSSYPPAYILLGKKLAKYRLEPSRH